jgi:mannose-6-phosphate isomerase-like protein (cupin superfamily)
MSVGHIVRSGEGELRNLGIVSMRVLADAEVSEGLLSVLEFRGGSGPWTVPHAHRNTEETFYVLEGTFDFLCGTETVSLEAGDYLLVPRGTPHMITAQEPGGALLGILAPAGLEEMFRELSQMPANSIRDPRARRELAERHDATPV